ncbi:LacI family DNA-binding transcriptional regulator [Alteromonas mediterranea]|uniref:LacI family transcriptional regulator n=1 Tax=Alteromonas mediterranea (strain DSM 17117 / CIP 110805 / LMG 28347 / Deep ecotype) TaxID=1774373 RepID=F2G9T1_ALTMD|nr:LacI family DNA-binding transcriptional regulator [Alteromonas mediterranea]AEA99931.1 LacI family transcriptional regulator [Alteromonas mediterranea DE]CAH1189197.1 HTH-type transcriptional regulator GalR [Alteromonas mediterranea]
MATIYQVSEAAGVSLATVSRVMNGNAKVSERTRKKVEDAMASLGYQPNAIAQSLASNRTNSVGLLVSELHGSYFGDLMSTVENVLKQNGKHVIITAGHVDEKREHEAIEFLKSRRCDALILHAEAVSDDYLKKLVDSKIHVVVINRKVDELDENCFVVDNEQGGYLATKAAIDAGHKHIAYISGPLFKKDASDRLSGHKKALEEAGIPFAKTSMFEGDFHESSGQEGMLYLQENYPELTALVCANDEMASGAMTAAREAGFDIPDQLSIIGFDNVLFSRYLYPKLTTINNPINAMGEMAAFWVLEHVYDIKSPIPIEHLFVPEMIDRDTLGNL